MRWSDNEAPDIESVTVVDDGLVASPSVTSDVARLLSCLTARSWRLRGSGECCPFGAPARFLLDATDRRLSRAGLSAPQKYQPPVVPSSERQRGVSRRSGRAVSERGVSAQPLMRARRRAASSSLAASLASSLVARSLGSSASEPSISRQTPPIAMPKTPWPPWSRSMTSSLLVHS